MKKCLFAIGLIFFLTVATAPAAAEKVIIDVGINGLEMFDVAAFDLNVTYNDSMIAFDRYFLTDALGSISLEDAEDWSLGDMGGSVNLAVLSYLSESDLGLQPDDFTLATLIFDTTVSGLIKSGTDTGYGIALTDVMLSDTYGDPIPFNIAGTEISAVPVPAAAWLLGTGVIGLLAVRRPRRS